VKGLVDDTTNVRLNAKVVLNNIVNGKPYGIVFKFTPIVLDTTAPTPDETFHVPTDGTKYKILLKVNGNTLFNK
jgi:hypothetical protein